MLEFPENYFRGEELEGFYVEEMMKRAWAAQIKVLKEIERICQKRGITYFADYGTLLGAVRHKGFIPWDDDIDIAMKPTDYKRFLQIAEQELPEGWKLLSLYNNDEYTKTFARVVNSDRINNYKEWLDEWFGCPFVVGVDIFPLNYMPLDEDEAEIQKELYIIVKNARAVCQEHTEEAEQLLKLVEEVCRVTLDRSGNLERQLSMLLERIRIMYDAEEQGELTQIEVFSRKSFCRIPQEAYEKSIPMMFEGTDVQVPVGWDTVLRAEYGDDYMTPIQVRSSACHDYPFYKKQMKILEERSKGKQ